MASPPPPLLNVIGGTLTYNNNEEPHPPSSSSSSIKTLSPSIIIIILILTVTVIVSVSLCLLLRHLNRRCIRHLSTTTTTTTTSSSTANSIAAVDSHRHSSRRVSPETPTFSLIDSLPLFTFSSITRRQASTNGGDCAVCLSKFEPQDQLRLLPLCCHAFHAHCIDTWLQSNQTCPLCRSVINASESDLAKALLASSNGNGGGNGSDSFRLEIGSISRRRATSSDFGEPTRSSYSIGSFDYIVEEESEITVSRRSVSDKEENGADSVMEPSLAADVASGRSWLKDYVDRLSSISSRALSFRSSGRFFTGSSRRSDIAGSGDWDLEANRVGEEISELFRWFSGV